MTVKQKGPRRPQARLQVCNRRQVPTLKSTSQPPSESSLCPGDSVASPPPLCQPAAARARKAEHYLDRQRSNYEIHHRRCSFLQIEGTIGFLLSRTPFPLYFPCSLLLSLLYIWLAFGRLAIKYWMRRRWNRQSQTRILPLNQGSYEIMRSDSLELDMMSSTCIVQVSKIILKCTSFGIQSQRNLKTLVVTSLNKCTYLRHED